MVAIGAAYDVDVVYGGAVRMLAISDAVNCGAQL